MVKTPLSKAERAAATLISELHSASATVEIETYLTFADKWNTAFPKSNKKLYDKGQKAIKTGAKQAGVSPRLVYTILSVTKLYDRKTYSALAAKAQKSGIVIRWTHLRDIESRLRDNQAIREEIEAILVQKPLTSKQLKEEIDALLPAVKTSKQPLLKRLDSVAAVFRRASANQDECAEVIELLSSIQINDADQRRIAIERLTELHHCFEELRDFLDDVTDSAQQLCDVLLTDANAEEDGMQEVVIDNRDILLEAVTD